LRRRETAHLERDGSLHDRRPECAQTIVAQRLIIPLYYVRTGIQKFRSWQLDFEGAKDRSADW
jgi:hypothetical protein